MPFNAGFSWTLHNRLHSLQLIRGENAESTVEKVQEMLDSGKYPTLGELRKEGDKSQARCGEVGLRERRTSIADSWENQV